MMPSRFRPQFLKHILKIAECLVAAWTLTEYSAGLIGATASGADGDPICRCEALADCCRCLRICGTALLICHVLGCDIRPRGHSWSPWFMGTLLPSPPG